MLSDTHGRHEGLAVPEGDVLIHAGDLTAHGHEHEVGDFLHWFSRVGEFRHRLFIAGNHDFFFERQPEQAADMLALWPDVTYLQDSGVEIDGVKFWGTPVQPVFFNWAFNRTEAQLAEHWQRIPPDTDVLVVHGPPLRCLDTTVRGTHAGSASLRQAIERDLPQVKVLVTGHIHEARGESRLGQVRCFNASVLDERYRRVHQPLEVAL